MKRIKAGVSMLFLMAAIGGLSGCTTPPGAESDIPWNVPQSWEGGGMFFPGNMR